METITLQSASRFSGKPAVPGDKSISHRALILGTLARGKTRVSGLLRSADVRSTRACLERLGAGIRDTGADEIEIEGLRLEGLRDPSGALDCGNSGTTMRLLAGVLAAQRFDSILIGDESLQRRPMRRVSDPLAEMGARIQLHSGDFAPLKISGTDRSLAPLKYDLPIASAQIKSALLLAGLFAEGRTILGGKIQSRDHTERLFGHFGIPLLIENGTVSVQGGRELLAADVKVPGDFSTAAFWIAAALMIPGARLELERISLNPTRTGFLRVLQRMGAEIEVETREHTPEPWGTIRARASKLQAARISSDEIPEMIDELPILAVLATQAEGTTEVRGARELRVKESDRLEMIGQALRAMGVELELFEDGFSICGPQKLRGAKIRSSGDHRIAMAFSIAAMIAEGSTEIEDPGCVAVSYPEFYRTLRELAHV